MAVTGVAFKGMWLLEYLVLSLNFMADPLHNLTELHKAHWCAGSAVCITHMSNLFPNLTSQTAM